MLYEILLRTKCAYELPAAGRLALRLTPADLPGQQRLIASSISILPEPEDRADRYDFFGNLTTDISLDKPTRAVELVMRARVARSTSKPDGAGSPPLAALAAQLAICRDLDAHSPHHFIEASPLVGASPAIRDYVLPIASQQGSTFEIVNAINEALHRDMAYDSEATLVDTPLEEAFERRRGVCQDFTHIMIACLREIGVPAGYVSGFLRTEPPKGQPRLEGADAMHAWVQAWCGTETGWIEFDPTNAMVTGADHIVAARGRDYSDVSPVRGVLRLSGAQEISQAVDVIPVKGAVSP